ncbi:uncharacterized protein (TIGR02246 family) [Arthrobacter stackebrandtii]|uniref:Uncharacterized protein (TIGR02246 family) n=1 Tax=Arthrobacter stackebrandtii TaxID=272161 RepID=A0ABS4Z292_9MICC|nr:SgcJ/EcaC family oxidoreductase [Arthrobacter stackebrandtii]MBP2414822.1 uncharacterized protein (TIGR02246 family) [Arthrobacter stackebrandtii]PYG99481.1 DUF4440 domain-containing protein [Arthrobacter stackebrandtii]
MLDRPEDVAAGFASAWNDADADDLAALFTDDAAFVNVVGLWWSTRGQIRDAHAYGFAHIFPHSSMSLGKVTVRRIGADTAVVHAAWVVTGQVTPDGKPAGRRRGVFSFVMAKQGDGGWLCVSAHNTDRVPGAETHVAEDGAFTPASYRPKRMG